MSKTDYYAQDIPFYRIATDAYGRKCLGAEGTRCGGVYR